MPHRASDGFAVDKIPADLPSSPTRQGVKFVVSFSDPANGHNGGIYKAANFKHLGKSNAEWHVVDKNGVLRHRHMRTAMRGVKAFRSFKLDRSLDSTGENGPKRSVVSSLTKYCEADVRQTSRDQMAW